MHLIIAPDSKYKRENDANIQEKQIRSILTHQGIGLGQYPPPFTESFKAVRLDMLLGFLRKNTINRVKSYSGHKGEMLLPYTIPAELPLACMCQGAKPGRDMGHKAGCEPGVNSKF